MVEAGVNPEWTRVTSRAYSLQVNSPGRYKPVHVYAIIQAKDLWQLCFDHRHIATFETFEELDGMVPVLVNGYLRRNE